MSAEQAAFDFSDVSSSSVLSAALTCAFSEPWMGPHPLCEAETDRACQQFAEAVARGEFDAQGYTPNERKAQAKRRIETV